jgi:hypothetical protein
MYNAHNTSRALYHPSGFHLLVWIYFLLFLTYWLWSLLQLWASIKDSLDMFYLYRDRLRIRYIEYNYYCLTLLGILRFGCCCHAP